MPEEYDLLEDVDAFEEMGEADEFDDYELSGLGELEEIEDDLDGFEDDELEMMDDLEGDDGLGEFGDLEFDEGFEGFEFEDEPDFEDEAEFFKKVFRSIKGFGKRLIRGGLRALRRFGGPLFKMLAPLAARIVGGVIGGPAGVAIANAITGAVLREAASESAGEAEELIEEGVEAFEEAGGDLEAYELMEEYAAEAAEAESEERALVAIGRMLRQITRLFRGNRKLRGILPRVIRGALALARTLRGTRRTRWALQVIPLIVMRTLTRLARARRITPRLVVRVMAQQTAWVLANRRRALAALRRHRMNRRRVRVRVRVRRPRRVRRRVTIRR